MFSIGIDLGGTKIAVGLVDEHQMILGKVVVPTKSDRHYTEIIADMAQAINTLCEKERVSALSAKGIGIGSPGTVDSKEGIIRYANNIRFENVPMREELRRHLDLPIFVSNDANCAALGETSHHGAAKGLKNVVMITLGTGVGGGIIIDGKIYEGNQSAGAELGHSLLVVDGVRCTCGRSGCWESYSSATALIRSTTEVLKKNKETIMWDMIDRDYEKISGRTAFDASRKGDAVAHEVVNHYIKYLSEGIIDMVNIFRPEVILIGGGISNEGESLFSPIREYVARYAYGGTRTPIPPIIRAKLGNDAGIIGAAMLIG
jgi:glucokinase